MKLRIANIHGHGDADEEFVLIPVDEDCDLKRFMLADTTYTDEHVISNKVRHVHWFRPKKVKLGDIVELRTGTGKDRSVAQEAGSTRHVIHWGLREPIWNDNGDGAVLFALKGWSTMPVSGK